MEYGFTCPTAFPEIGSGSGSDLLAPLLYVSPTQINYLLSADDVVPYAGGFAYIAIERIGSPFAGSAIVVPLVPTAPGFFTVNAMGVAAATGIRLAADGSQTPLPVYSCSRTNCSAVPIDVTAGIVYLSLYGTGFDVDGISTIGCSASGNALFVTYAGPQGYFNGLDQLNVLLPAKLSGARDEVVRCSFGQNAANLVHITIQ